MTTESFSTQDLGSAAAACTKHDAHLCSQDEITSEVYGKQQYHNIKWGMYNEKGRVARAFKCFMQYAGKCYQAASGAGGASGGGVECSIATLQMNAVKNAYCCQ